MLVFSNGKSLIRQNKIILVYLIQTKIILLDLTRLFHRRIMKFELGLW